MAQYFEATGRRKESTARVRITSGSGTFTVNDKPLEVYFPRTGDAPAILSALEATGQTHYDGYHCQSGRWRRQRPA